MNFFKIEGNGFIICLGIILLLTGLIMIYVKQRFAVYDRLISEQNKLLKHVVSNIENLSTQHFQSARDLSNPIALASAVDAAKTVKQLNLTTPLDCSEEKCEKIVVSDDEDDDSSHYTDDGEESEEEESSEESSDTISESEAISTTNQTKVLKIDNFNFNNIKHLKDSESSDSDEIEIDSDSDSDTDESSEDNELIKRKNDAPFGIKVVELDLPLEIIEQEYKTELDNLVIEHVTQNQSEDIHQATDIKLDFNEVNDDANQSISKNTDLEDNFTLNELSLLKKHELEAMCREKKVSSKGTRMELIKRLSKN